MTVPESRARGVVPVDQVAASAPQSEAAPADRHAETTMSPVDGLVVAAPAAPAAPAASAVSAAQAATAAEAIGATRVATAVLTPATVVDAPARGRGPDRDGRPGGGDGVAGSGRPTPLHIGSHTVSRSALATFRLAVPRPGLLVGVDQRQQPVPMRFFRHQPTRVTLVGGAWAGQLVVFRALALGARVAVITAEPALWDRFGEWATGRRDRVVVYRDERALAFPATAVRPALIVYDLGVVGPTVPTPPSPWQTQFTILRTLDRAGAPAIQEGQLVLLQRLSPVEAIVAATALRLPAASVDLLQAMPNDVLALHSDGPDQYAWLALTGVEQEYFGEPRR